MTVLIKETDLPDVLLIQSDIHADKRGFFKELYHKEKYSLTGLDVDFVQDNHSHSTKGVLRGLHYQLRMPQGKLISVISGEIFDVAVDIRQGSPYFGKWAGVHLTPESGLQMYLPEGFAHGFCVLSSSAEVLYKCTDFYAPEHEYGLLWSDETVNIDWPVKDPIVSDIDNAYPKLSDIPAEQLPVY